MSYITGNPAFMGPLEVSSAGNAAAAQPSPWGGLAAAGLGVAGSVIGGILGNRANKREAQRNRDFQLWLSNTAHQREVADLRAAGLNPILSATGGPGASTPSGSMAQQSDVISPAMSSAASLMREMVGAFKSMAEAQKTVAETNNAYSQPALTGALTQQASTAAELNIQKTAQSNYENRVQEALWDNPDMAKIIRDNFVLENAIKRADKDMAVREANRMKKLGEMDDSKFGPLLLFIERVFGSVLKRR